MTTLRPVTMDFRYGEAFGDAGPEAYERLILESMLGDATLFARSDEVRAFAVHRIMAVSPVGRPA